VTGAEVAKIRWLIRKDMPRVLEIDSELGIEDNESEYLELLRKRNGIGMVSEFKGLVVAYAIYMLHAKSIEILHFAVDPNYSGRGVGRQFMEYMFKKLSIQKRDFLSISVNEYNVELQVFLKAVGFRCVSSERGFFDGADRLEFRRKAPVVAGGLS
jgi:ribosomal protein S18 acetylase RimI-like enzyme